MNNHFSQILLNWYAEHRRYLPWRKTKNPYFVWLSEVILQQTRVAQGWEYYLNFLENFPTIADLAKANEEKVLKLWQGLGYYSRARNLHFSAKYIMNECNGVFPQTYKEILKLKGVGDYTASAVASICFDEPTAVVDGNVYRVLARYFGVETPINSTDGIKYFKELAQMLIDPKQAGIYNQAIMDFGAMQCTPQNPNCTECVFNESCKALEIKKVKELPIKINKTTVKKRYFNYLVFKTDNGQIALQKRTKGIWKNLYQFPLIESGKSLKINDVANHKSLYSFAKNEPFEITSFYEKEVVHKLSHRHLFVRFWIISIDKIEGKTIPFDTIEKYPVPILIHNFIEDFKKF
ncbi:MAG: A/G-specific adenine glycosylase [Flavobacteriaceae bacterium]|nr:A/G-specific adenine glycosylase [Flavobacteriaceae bacterium]